MPTHVYANTNEIASKAADGKSIAAFPDVCFTPPAPPVGPLPLPYPNTGEVKDTDKGTTKVFIKDKMAGMEGDSYISKSMGDEPATQSQGKGIITGALQGKCYFGVWSMDVKMEGKGVPRHLDMVTHNHGSQAGNGGVGSDVDCVSGGSDGKSIEIVRKKHCYNINFVDMYGNKITESHLGTSPLDWDGDASYRVGLFPGDDNRFDYEVLYYDECLEIHDISNIISIHNNTDSQLGFRIICYSTFIKDNKFFKNETSNDTDKKLLMADNVIVCAHRSNQKCSRCDGKLYDMTVKIMPSPTFPVLQSGAWHQITAYNLAIMSNVAYCDDYYKVSNSSNTRNEFNEDDYEGSLHDITCRLCVSENVKTPDDYYMVINRPLSINAAKQNIKKFGYIYSKLNIIGNACYAVLANKKQIIIAFRGTASCADAIADLSIKHVKYDSGFVHVGFYEYYKKVEPSITRELENLYTGTQEVFITGHSLGGAVALLCANEMKKLYKKKNLSLNLSLYTYGMPRVFDEVAVEGLEDFPHYRHVYESDIVPRMVPNYIPDKIPATTMFGAVYTPTFRKKEINAMFAKRVHAGYLCYLEMNSSFLDKILGKFEEKKGFGKITPSERSKEFAISQPTNATHIMYHYTKNNIDKINSVCENILMISQYSFWAAIRDIAATHGITNYIAALKPSQRGVISVGKMIDPK